MQHVTQMVGVITTEAPFSCFCPWFRTTLVLFTSHFLLLSYFVLYILHPLPCQPVPPTVTTAAQLSSSSILLSFKTRNFETSQHLNHVQPIIVHFTRSLPYSRGARYWTRSEHCYCHSHPYTNAEAFARGLPPLHPRRQGFGSASFATCPSNIGN